MSSVEDEPPSNERPVDASAELTELVGLCPWDVLVIVRMGHMRGQGPARQTMNTALGLVVEAVNER